MEERGAPLLGKARGTSENLGKVTRENDVKRNKAGYTATPVACRWAGAKFEVSGAFAQEQQSHNRRKSIV